MPKVVDERAAKAFGETLFSIYENFQPTRALYPDFEGSGSGNEQIMSVYWPQLAGAERFRMLWRGWSDVSLEPLYLGQMLDDFECDPGVLESIAVFSSMVESNSEQFRYQRCEYHPVSLDTPDRVSAHQNRLHEL